LLIVDTMIEGRPLIYARSTPYRSAALLGASIELVQSEAAAFVRSNS
jgi:hypothetical protein